MNYLELARQHETQIIAWRRDIHQHPELGFEEKRTASLVANALRDMGIEIETGIGRTGVVAHIGNGNGRKIGIRADMDALPIQETVDLPFASKIPGKMHACGHDAHTAILLGVASILQSIPEIDGEIRLLFQPSEERWEADGTSGATAMIADHAMDDLDAVIALHVNSLLPVGQIEVTDGMALAAVDTFTATVFGTGCHGATPHVGVDPIWIAAQVINAIQSIRSRRTNPTSASVVTIGSIHAGSAPNVIPDQVTFSGTIRSFEASIREQIHAELDRAFSIAKTLGGDYTLDINHGYPSLHNDPKIASLMREVSAGYLGGENATVGKPMMGGEDFAYMAQKVPGAMLTLGARYDDVHRPHHSPIFALGEDSFKYGSAILAESAIRLLQQD